MKVFSLSILFILSIAFHAIAQPGIQWQKSLGGSADDGANFIKPTNDGGYIIAGYSDSNDGDVTGHHGSANLDYWIVKTDGNGSIQWQKSLGGSLDEEAESVLQTTDGGYIIAGYADSSSDGDVSGNHGSFDFWIVKLTSGGGLEWQKCFGGSLDDEAFAIQKTNDGGYVVAGTSYSIDGDLTHNNGGYDYWVVKLQSNGTILWQKSMGGSGDEYAYDIKQTADSGFIIAGTSASNDSDVTGNHGGNDYWIVKLTPGGNIQWEKSFGGSGDDEAYAVDQTTDGGYIIAGFSTSTDGNVTGNHGSEDYWIIKLNSAGTLQWEHSLGGASDDEAYSIHQTTDGGYLIAGNTYSTAGNVTGNHGGSDYWIVKTDNMGIIQWQKCLGGSSSEYAYCINEAADGGYVIAGRTFSSNDDVTANHGIEDYWIVKLNSQVGIEELFSIDNTLSIYPNPARDQFTIYDLRSAINSINIYNIGGDKVYNYQLSIINYQLSIDISSLPAGLYFAEAVLQNGNRISKKFIKE